MNRHNRMNNLRRSIDGHHKFKSTSGRVKVQSEGGALENLIYELKPLLYIGVIAHVFFTHSEMSVLTKAAGMGVTAFGIYLMYSRLVYRGHL